ncbi:MAG: type IX secretion system sortase PorU [Microscillaceae bacterium]|jgi:hypothetical protein|nr:type IX secretion system sortase PorU [Microscillaceae bacterium]
MKSTFENKFYVLLIGICLISSNLRAQFAQNSVLREGVWYKIGIVNSGIYRLDAGFLRQAGVNVGTINPQNIRLYGNGGGMLPQANQTPRIDDLQENAIWVQGEADGQFNEQDFVLFYAESADKWTLNPNTQLFEHQKNLYADTTYYYLTVGNSAGLRVQNEASAAGASLTLETFDAYTFYEREINNILRSGREWYGEQFGFQNEQRFNLNVQGIVANSTLKLSTALMSKDFNGSNYQVAINSTTLGNVNIEAVGSGTYDLKGENGFETFAFNATTFANAETLPITLRYNSLSGTGIGYLNFLRVNFQKSLKLYNTPTTFRALASVGKGVVNYRIGEANSNVLIWNITQINQIKNQIYQLNGNQAVFGANAFNLQEFIVFQPNQAQTPPTIRGISNQNLHALATPDLLIVTAPIFRVQAQRLADFRQTHDGLSVAVVTTEQIYNEFSSGKADITAIRDFARMLYIRNPLKIKYLLLFGGASFDYKNRVPNNTNFVPIYESRQSLHPIFSYSSDDYFGLLENDEGDWAETGGDNSDLDIGIGRLMVRNLQEAQQVVDKLMYYSTNPQTLGEWRNRVSFVADDGDGNTHQVHADELAELIEKDYPNFTAQKHFMDAFTQISTPNGELCLELKNEIDDEVKRGVLILNYTGHGGEVGWSEEKILDIAQIRAWRNLNNMPLFVTATCEFGRYDDPFQTSGAEEALLNARGGAIGLITTTRPVFASTNLVLNRAFYQSIFKPIGNEMPRLGDAVKATKNLSKTGVVNRNFALLGDPSLRLAYPAQTAQITKINGLPLADDTLRALQNTRIEGEIKNAQGVVNQDFNGVIEMELFDKRQTLQTKGTSASPMSYQDRTILLFKGTAEVKNGKFIFNLIIPKDINYNLGKGRIDFYARNNDNTLDASGANNSILIGGSERNVPVDNTPPQLNVYLNNESFVSGNVIERDAVLWAKLNDASGINISQAGLGHEIIAFLDNKKDSVWVLNDYYTADLNTFQRGTVRYPMQNLPLGKHRLTMQVWDTYNNVNSQSIDFEVVNNPIIQLIEVKNYPNPFSTQTTFSFKHNRVGRDLQIIAEIYNTNGKLIRTLHATQNESPETIKLEWQDLHNSGNQINAGIYFYKITVYSPADGARGQVSKKMIKN